MDDEADDDRVAGVRGGSEKDVCRDSPLPTAVAVAIVVLDTPSAVVEFGWVDAPSYPGWWTQRVDPPEQVTPVPVEVAGVRYNRFTVSRHALIALRDGDLVIPAARARVGARGRGFLDPGQVVETAASEVRVAVVERPPAPAGYGGAVGELRYSGSVEPGEILLGESAVVTVQVEGTGNLPLVETPAEWPTCEGCELFPPENVDRVAVDEKGIHGRRAWGERKEIDAQLIEDDREIVTMKTRWRVLLAVVTVGFTALVAGTKEKILG